MGLEIQSVIINKEEYDKVDEKIKNLEESNRVAVASLRHLVDLLKSNGVHIKTNKSDLLECTEVDVTISNSMSDMSIKNMVYIQLK